MNEYLCPTPAQSPVEEYVNDVVGTILEKYYKNGEMSYSVSEYYRGIIDCLFKTGQLEEPEYDVFQFMLDKLVDRGRGH